MKFGVGVQGDFEERMNELRQAKDQTKKAMTDAARLAEELRQEQDHGSQMDKLRRALEGQVKELQVRVDEAEAAALHGGRKTIQSLEQRVRRVQLLVCRRILYMLHLVSAISSFFSSSTSFWYQFFRFLLTYFFTYHFFLFCFTTLYIYNSLSLSLPA